MEKMMGENNFIGCSGTGFPCQRRWRVCIRSGSQQKRCFRIEDGRISDYI